MRKTKGGVWVCEMGMGQTETTRKLQVFVHLPFTRVQIGCPCLTHSQTINHRIVSVERVERSELESYLLLSSVDRLYPCHTSQHEYIVTVANSGGIMG